MINIATIFALIILLLCSSLGKAHDSDREDKNGIINKNSSSSRHLEESKQVMCAPIKPIPPLRWRHDIGPILHEEGKKKAIELGVREGDFAFQTVSAWKTCENYHLVDLWQHQEHYMPTTGDAEHNQNMNDAFAKMNKAKEAGHIKSFTFCRNYTNNCHQLIENESVDFIYVDARHDYKGTLEDLQFWWPKLKYGGIMGGHDYMTQDDVDMANKGWKWQPDHDWTKNYDGTVDSTKRCVRGAVDDFFNDKFGDMKGCPRQIMITYQEHSHFWKSFFARK